MDVFVVTYECVDIEHTVWGVYEDSVDAVEDVTRRLRKQLKESEMDDEYTVVRVPDDENEAFFAVVHKDGTEGPHFDFSEWVVIQRTELIT